MAVRKSLGRPASSAPDFVAPLPQELDNISALWDSIVPARWRGLLETVPKDSGVKAKFYRDEATGKTYRANGKLVTQNEWRAAFLAFQKGLQR